MIFFLNRDCWAWSGSTAVDDRRVTDDTFIADCTLNADGAGVAYGVDVYVIQTPLVHLSPLPHKVTIPVCPCTKFGAGEALRMLSAHRFGTSANSGVLNSQNSPQMPALR